MVRVTVDRTDREYHSQSVLFRAPREETPGSELFVFFLPLDVVVDAFVYQRCFVRGMLLDPTFDFLQPGVQYRYRSLPALYIDNYVINGSVRYVVDVLQVHDVFDEQRTGDTPASRLGHEHQRFALAEFLFCIGVGLHTIRPSYQGQPLLRGLGG